MSKPLRPFVQKLGTGLLGVALMGALIGVLAVGSMFAEPARGSDAFVEGFEDLPLMPELRSLPASSVAFDTAVGRVVVAFAEGIVRMDKVIAFYDATLPQLGWRATGANRWEREGEQLTLDAVVEADGLVVRFELAPR